MKTKYLFIISMFFLPITCLFSQPCVTSVIQGNLYSPSKIIHSDFDGDGKDDLIFLDSLGRDIIWKKNLGSNQFSNAIILAGGGGEILFLKSGDLNNDGANELILANATSIFYIQYLSPTSIDIQSIFNAPILYFIDAMEVGDFNNDGYDGMVVSYYRASVSTSIVDVINNDNLNLTSQNILNGTFGFMTDIAVGDINGNGRMDIALAGYSNFWFRNNGNGMFSSHNTISSAGGNFGFIELMDYDNDGDIELINLNTGGDLKTFNIDISLQGWLSSPVTVLTGLTPNDPNAFEIIEINGQKAILVAGDDKLVGLENSNNTFFETVYCSDIPDLKGATYITDNGQSNLVYSRENLGTIEMISELQSANIYESETDLTNIIYPNPTSDAITINTSNNQIIKNIEVINTLGQTIKIEQVSINKYSLIDLPNGLYQVLIEYDNGNISNHLIMKQG